MPPLNFQRCIPRVPIKEGGRRRAEHGVEWSGVLLPVGAPVKRLMNKRQSQAGRDVGKSCVGATRFYQEEMNQRMQPPNENRYKELITKMLTDGGTARVPCIDNRQSLLRCLILCN
jgi:hypothetical protein